MNITTSKSRAVILIILTGFLTILIGNGCFLQPRSEIIREFNFVDYDAPAMRLARPVTGELLSKNEAGEWVNIGRGTIPAGAYIKGRAPIGGID